MAEGKKVIFILVEGPSDEKALSLIAKFYKNEKVTIHFTKGDFTSDFVNTHTNCIKNLSTIIKNLRDEYGLKRKDVSQVIHIIDTDGAFIPDKYIVKSEYKTNHYSVDCIETNNIRKIIERNNHKTEIVNILNSADKIDRSIKYRIFYMSCNLEHITINEMNLENELKNIEAFKFRDRFENDKVGFVNFFNSIEFKVNGTYKETWDFIKSDKNSLNRFTNLWIFINEILDSDN